MEQLSLYGCGLKNIQVKEKSFPKLSKLSLSNNKIALVSKKKNKSASLWKCIIILYIFQWQNISELDKLPSLVDLKLCGNQGLEVNSYETFSQWIIARIGKLQVNYFHSFKKLSVICIHV